MYKEHPVPNTPATKAPKVDESVTDYLKATFPRSNDGELMKVQSVLLKVCDPIGVHVGRVDIQQPAQRF